MPDTITDCLITIHMESKYPFKVDLVNTKGQNNQQYGKLNLAHFDTLYYAIGISDDPLL